MTQRSAYPSIRRVVTGHDGDVATYLIDGPATNAKEPDPGLVSTLIWSTDAMPADIAVGTHIEDMGQRKLGSAPPPNGTRFAVLDIPPGNPVARHRTDTLDFVIVLEGEIDMELADASQTVHLRAGEVMVQRGTVHAWINRSEQRARLAVVLIDGVPIPVAGALAHGTTATAS